MQRQNGMGEIIAARAVKFGAGGRTRTDTTFYGPRILSPVRLPFRHTGNYLFLKKQRSFEACEALGGDVVLLSRDETHRNRKRSPKHC